MSTKNESEMYTQLYKISVTTDIENTHVNIYVYGHVHEVMNTCMHAHSQHTCTCTYMHSLSLSLSLMHTHSYTRTNTHTHTHVCMHTHRHRWYSHFLEMSSAELRTESARSDLRKICTFLKFGGAS